MGKRIFLFLLTNLAIVVVLSIVLSILGVGNYVTEYGLDIRSLAIFSFVWGMGGAFLSLQMSRFIAKRATVKLLDASSVVWSKSLDIRHVRTESRGRLNCTS